MRNLFLRLRMCIWTYLYMRLGVGVYKRTFHPPKTLDLSSEKNVHSVLRLIKITDRVYKTHKCYNVGPEINRAH